MSSVSRISVIGPADSAALATNGRFSCCDAADDFGRFCCCTCEGHDFNPAASGTFQLFSAVCTNGGIDACRTLTLPIGDGFRGGGRTDLQLITEVWPANARTRGISLQLAGLCGQCEHVWWYRDAVTLRVFARFAGLVAVRTPDWLGSNATGDKHD